LNLFLAPYALSLTPSSDGWMFRLNNLRNLPACASQWQAGLWMGLRNCGLRILNDK